MLLVAFVDSILQIRHFSCDYSSPVKYADDGSSAVMKSEGIRELQKRGLEVRARSGPSLSEIRARARVTHSRIQEDLRCPELRPRDHPSAYAE